MELRTERLLLRRWREADRAEFAALNADPVVMEHFAGPLTAVESDAFIDRAEAEFEARDYGRWAVERLDTGQFIGFVGLSPVLFEAPFTPAVELGYRLAREHWDQGFATEASRAALGHGFERVGLDEIVAFTATTNQRSMRVMERLGMTHDPADDFDHPRVPAGHRLQRHVLYRLRRPA